MMKPGSMSGLIAAAALAVVCAAPAKAQFAGGTNDPQHVAGNTARENVRSAGLRSPGDMVSSGLARAQQAVRSPRLGFSITEQPTLTPRQTFLIDAINIVFNQLNQAIAVLDTVLRAQRGGSLSLPSASTASGGSGSTSGGATVIPSRNDLNRPR